MPDLSVDGLLKEKEKVPLTNGLAILCVLNTHLIYTNRFHDLGAKQTY